LDRSAADKLCSDAVRCMRLILHDAVCIAASLYFALLIRYSDSGIPKHILSSYPKLALITLILGIPIFWAFRIYRIHASYISLKDVLKITKAVLALTLLLFAEVQILGINGFPRGVYVIFCLLGIFSTVGGRSLFRVRNSMSTKLRSPNHRRKVLIIGAGATGESALRQIENSASDTHKVVGFLDDDPSKQKIDIHGVPVLGPCSKLVEVVQKHGVDDVLIAMPSASGSKIKELLKESEKLGVHLQIIHGLNYPRKRKWNGPLPTRPVQPEDLLDREQIKLDTEEISGYISGKRVLITGAGGSIGSELARQVLNFGPKELILLGKGEGSIFEIDEELRSERGAKPVPVIADITDRERMEQVFREHRPEVVFHAAAHKHVPLMEQQPEEAVKCNIIGTKNLVELSEEYGVERFVLISTDKAVKPMSVMGATKRVAEMIVQEAAGRNGRTKYMAVRFGNVLGSRGSVVPVMQKQISRGGPVTVTHPEMMRYFMTIPEAVQLVMQAGGMGEGGEVFVLDMGEPVRIMDLAKDLIRMSGYTPGEDIEIEVTGIRPGEKLKEEMLTAAEGHKATKHDKIYIAPLEHKVPEGLEVEIEELWVLARRGDREGIKRKLKELIPTYTPWQENCVANPTGEKLEGEAS
jgi:FlaA1/EpsC-like NDP-sugar epimerase